MIAEYIKKVKWWITENKADIYVAILIFLISMASFGLGRLSILWPAKQPVTITDGGIATKPAEKPTIIQTAVATAALNPQGKYVASKSGKNYHFPWCQSAQKISEQNKIWFQTKEEAEKAGYKPAANCPGL